MSTKEQSTTKTGIGINSSSSYARKRPTRFPANRGQGTAGLIQRICGLSFWREGMSSEKHFSLPERQKYFSGIRDGDFATTTNGRIWSGSSRATTMLLDQTFCFRWLREGHALKCRADNIKRPHVRSPVQEFCENLQHSGITA
jgi:hypothetical protein